MHVSDAVIVFHPRDTFEVRRPSRSKIWLILGHDVSRLGDFDL